MNLIISYQPNSMYNQPDYKLKPDTNLKRRPIQIEIITYLGKSRSIIKYKSCYFILFYFSIKLLIIILI
jgi:hypothetical protein